MWALNNLITCDARPKRMSAAPGARRKAEIFSAFSVGSEIQFLPILSLMRVGRRQRRRFHDPTNQSLVDRRVRFADFPIPPSIFS
jgi:hypothetical protein